MIKKRYDQTENFCRLGTVGSCHAAQRTAPVCGSDIVQDPKYPNIKREMIEDVSQKWLVHITGKLPVTATLNGHDYVDSD